MSNMEDLESPSAAGTTSRCSCTPSAYTLLADHGWRLQNYPNWKSKSSLLLLLGCVTLLALSYAALLSLPTDAFGDAPFLSPRIRNFFGIPHDDQQAASSQYERKLMEVFERAAMSNKTVIITTLNGAWAEEGSMIDIFLESFQHGDGTRKLLQHVVIVCVDNKAFQRCLAIHPHCFYIKTKGVDFSGEQLLLSEDYIKLMWRRIEFLRTVLEMNYNFIFTDTDVLWLRDPFPLLQEDTEADLQFACDLYLGTPSDPHNSPNAGFIYARANARTVRFYGYWHEERKRGSNMADQEVLNAIKFDEKFTSIGMKLRFLDTQFFGGFCALSTSDMTKAITMHATCCKGLGAKLIDLRMILDGWKEWHAQNSPMVLNRDSVDASPHNASAAGPLDLATGPASTPAPWPSHDVEKVELDPHFKPPWACPQSWHNHAPFPSRRVTKIFLVMNGNVPLVYIVVPAIVAIIVIMFIVRICIIRFQNRDASSTAPAKVELAPLPLTRSHTSSRGG